jgi:hypothetical protein
MKIKITVEEGIVFRPEDIKPHEGIRGVAGNLNYEWGEILTKRKGIDVFWSFCLYLSNCQ